MQYSLDNRGQDGDNILFLHRTNGVPNILEVNETINIAHSSLTIETPENSTLTIQAASHLNTLFNFKRNFTEIKFLKTTLFGVSDNTVSITLQRCTVDSIEAPLLVFLGSNHTSSTSIYIDESTIHVVGSFFNHSTSNNDELLMQIRDSRMPGGTIMSSTTPSPFNMIMQNVSYDVQQGYGGPEENVIKRITLENVIIQGNMNTTDFLNCNNCNLTITDILFVNTTINRGFDLIETLGSQQINQISLKSATVRSGFIFMKGSVLGIDEVILEINTSIVFDSILNVTQDSNATINTVKLSDVKSKSALLFAVCYESEVIVQSIDIRSSNFSGLEILRTGAASRLIVVKTHISNSNCYPAVLLAQTKHYNIS